LRGNANIWEATVPPSSKVEPSLFSLLGSLIETPKNAKRLKIKVTSKHASNVSVAVGLALLLK
jgi:hypothetical protein